MKYLVVFDVDVSYYLDLQQKAEAERCVNSQFKGKVSKKQEKAAFAVQRRYSEGVRVGVNPDGTLEIVTQGTQKSWKAKKKAPPKFCCECKGLIEKPMLDEEDEKCDDCADPE